MDFISVVDLHLGDGESGTIKLNVDLTFKLAMNPNRSS